VDEVFGGPIRFLMRLEELLARDLQYQNHVWDTPLNSVFIGRGLATIGEVTWIMQLALGLMWCARQIKKHD